MKEGSFAGTLLISGHIQYSVNHTYLYGNTPNVQSLAIGGGLFILSRGRSWDEWSLKTDLMVGITTCPQGWLATTHLDIAEYGFGKSLDEAVADLLTSLSDYRESLESREERLGQSAKGDLNKLRKLVEMQH